MLNPLPKIRALIVDDQVLVADAVRLMLSVDEDVVVQIVSVADVALAAAVDFAPTVLLQDVLMPQKSGLQLIREYRRNPALVEVPIIVLSGVDEPHTKRQPF
jgi:two-component system chemotaxis family response regulator WspR